WGVPGRGRRSGDGNVAIPLTVGRANRRTAASEDLELVRALFPTVNNDLFFPPFTVRPAPVRWPGTWRGLAAVSRADRGGIHVREETADTLGWGGQRERPVEIGACRRRARQPDCVGRSVVRLHRPLAGVSQGPHKGYPGTSRPVLRQRRRQTPLGHDGGTG